MQSVPKTRWFRQLAYTAVTGVVALVGTAVSFTAASPAHAAAATLPPESNQWFMLVNDHYDSSYDGVNHCLSTNAQTSNSGANTHFVYLVPCKTSTAAQWWIYNDATGKITNRANLDGTGWQLSANHTTPAGGDVGTFGAYTAAPSNAQGHVWSMTDAGVGPNIFILRSGLAPELSASVNNPEIPGTMRVYTTGVSESNTHYWRPFHLGETPPTP